jgi:hypothetical protein
MALATPAAAAFTLSNDEGGDGYVVDGPSPFDFTLFGADNDVGENTTLYVQRAGADRTISGTFKYTPHDGDGARVDPGGFWLSGVKHALTPFALRFGDSFSGAFAFDVLEGDHYGFYVSSVDSYGGRGEIAIHLDAPPAAVPEPAAWSLMIAGFGLTGALLRRRRIQIAPA